jgi:hypothetical protein
MDATAAFAMDRLTIAGFRPPFCRFRGRCQTQGLAVRRARLQKISEFGGPNGVTPLWLFTPWLPYQFSDKKLVKECSFINGEEVFQARSRAGTFWPQFPTARLKLTWDEFDVDCFSWETYTLVSERMRDAMAMSPSEVQFFDVDASESAAGPRSKAYKLMNVAVAEDVADLERSKYTLSKLSPESEWLPLGPTHIAIRANASPTHDMFHESFFRGHVFCNDALAMRVLEAGCTGIRFLDFSEQITRPPRFRTLRGIEEEVKYDPFRKVLHTRVVSGFH